MVVNSEQDLGRIGEDDKRQCWFRLGRVAFTNISLRMGDFVATKPQWRIAAARD